MNVPRRLPALLPIVTLLLAACSSPMTKATGVFEQGMKIKETQPVKAAEYFATAKEQFFDITQLGGLADPEKIEPLSYIVRIYLEQRDAERAERQIVKAAEYVDLERENAGENVALRLIQGLACERLAANAVYRVEEKPETESEILRDKALKHLEDALVHYYQAKPFPPDLFIERFVDLFKIRAFVTKAAIFEAMTRGGKRHRLDHALHNYRSAMEIVRRNEKMQFAFEKDFAAHQRTLSAKIESLTMELTK